MRQLSSSGDFEVRWRHRVFQCRGALGPDGDSLAALIPQTPSPARVLTVIDEGLATSQPDLTSEVAAWARHHEDRLMLAGAPLVVPGGERAKNDRTVVDQTIRAINDRHICRRSYVLAIGGGAMLDAAGFAAATAHRGVRLIRLPSTTLAQADAGVGVKNGINAFGTKNLVGTFAPPWAVVNDTLLLGTLADRDWRAGISEAVKVAILKDPTLLDFVEANADFLRRRDLDAMEVVVERTADLHIQHIVEGGDPFESDRARPLDFGHWSAHRLEQMTGFRLTHGDAVAIGLLIDLQYAALREGQPATLARRVADCFTAMGFPLHCDAMTDEDRLLEGLELFREHLGGELAITLATRPGHSEETSCIDDTCMRQAIRLTFQRGAEQASRAG